MKKKLTVLNLATILIILTTLLTSCVSDKTAPTYVVRTVYDVPPLFFYDFPRLKDAICIPLDIDNKVVKDDKTEIVNCVVPWWYIQLLAEFSLHYDETIRQYNYYKEIESEYKKLNVE